MALAALLFTSCSDFTDLQPKGKNLLSTVDQLEMLLNKEMMLGSGDDMRLMSGDYIYATSSVATTLSNPVKTRRVIMWTFDESNLDKMAELTSTDDDYSDFYGLIGTVCNPILQQIDNATGDEAVKKQVKCEALTLRAWAMYILINKFAKAYNPSTAATDPGIIIMTENTDIQTPQPQSTVQEVYDQILKDVNEAIELDALPVTAVNKMRVSKAAVYAVKALTLLNMQDWTGAEEAAKEALALNGTVNDYNKQYQGTVTGYYLGNTYPIIERGKEGTAEDYLLGADFQYYNILSPETVAKFEKGYAYIDKMQTLAMEYDYTIDPGTAIMGDDGYFITYGYSSFWNLNGLRSPQMYLTCAECEWHNGNIDTAMDYLDKVRVCRIDADNYQPLKGSVTTLEEAKAKVKQVTWEESFYSEWLFINKKRWNQLDGWKETCTRTLVGTTYSLTPDSKMWIFPFPQDVMSNNPLIKQNYKE